MLPEVICSRKDLSSRPVSSSTRFFHALPTGEKLVQDVKIF